MMLQRLVLVTGATGFVGSHLGLALLRQGFRVRLLVRNQHKLIAELVNECEIVIGDLCDKGALLVAAEGVDLVFHCAANVNTWDSDEAYFRVNSSGTRLLLEALVERGGKATRFVHVSSLDVYGFPKQPSDESAPLKSQFGYGRSKIAGEFAVRELCEFHDFTYSILRPGNIIGPGSQFVERIGEALDHGVMALVDGGGAHAGLVYIDNLVDVLIWAAKAPEAVNACINVRDITDMDWREFVFRFRDEIRGHGVVISLPRSIAMFSARVLTWISKIFVPNKEPLWHPLLVNIFGRTCGHSIKRLTALRGQFFSVGIDEAMQKSIQWYQTHRRSR
jgi:nucleoside-diphosphate-sugar epimerase